MPMAADAQTAPQQAPPPASMTELSQQGRSLKPDVMAPDKGLLTNSADILREASSARVLHNLQMLKRGIWSSRGTGFTKERAIPFNMGTSFIEIGNHGGTIPVFQVGTSLFTYDLTTHAETLLGTVGNTNVACMRSFGPQLFIVAQDSGKPQKWDGIVGRALSNLGGWNPSIGGVTYINPPFVEVFNNRAVFAGMPTNPQVLVLSDYGAPGSYTTSVPAVATDAGAIVIPTSLGLITGLRTVRLSNEANSMALIIGCTNGMAMLTGSSPDDFTLRELTRSFGVVNNRTWIQLGNDIYFLATDGIRKFSNVYFSSSMTSVPESYSIQDVFNRRNKAAAAAPFAVHHPDTQEVHWFFPRDNSTTNNSCVILNYSTRNPSNPNESSPDVVFSTKDTTATCGFELNGTMYHGNSSGYLFVDYSGDTYDGTVITWEYLSPFIPSNSPAQSASARRFIILTEGGDQKFTCSAYVVETLSNGQSRFKLMSTMPINQVAESITKLGTWPSGSTTTYPKLINFESKGSGRFWALRMTGTGSGEHIDLVGIQSILVVGGWRQ